MADTSTQYNPADYEADTYTNWEKSGAFSADNSSKKKPFVITLPPPNITGSLHMGHALQDTIMDALIRYHRMKGEPTTWIPGTDSAAIATNRIIVDQLAEEGVSRHDLGRDEFLKRVDAWYEKTGSEIVNQMRRLGCSCDWDRLRFTMDDEYIKAVNHAFVEYYNKGYIYRGHRIVSWDPKHQTTVSDLEIDRETEKAPFYTFKYGPFRIGTARPETKFGDKYVVMHPDDERYSDYKHGDQFDAEWINGKIKATVIKDESVDPTFGTGVMTITPWHDATDFEIAERHDLDKEQIIDLDGNLLEVAGEFAGQSIAEARPKIVEKLESKSLLVSVDENYEHNVALNDRGKGIIEPQIMEQWFVKMDELKKPAMTAAQEGEVKFSPSRWQKHFLSWLENMHDWNISRQIWLGHRIPAWYKDGEVKVQVDSPGEGWEQDEDVLDTWFATALWSFAPLGWPEETEDLKNLHPTSVLVTARDILYLWVARMVFSSLEFLGEVPFENVFIHPTVLAKDGRRMSKSLGTGIDPLELIDEYGADATRFGLMYQMSFDTQAIKFDSSDVESARNFANKIWNINKLLVSLSSSRRGDRGEVESSADAWIQSRLGEVTQNVTDYFDEYKIGEAAHELHQFVWQDFADWYVEILKTQGSTKVAKEVFVETLKLLHPIMPFITEALTDEDIISADWPSLSLTKGESPAGAGEGVENFQDVVSTTRSIRVMLGLKPNEPLELCTETDIADLEPALEAMAFVSVVDARSEDMKDFPLKQGGKISISSPAITDDVIASAKERLASEREKTQQHVEKTEAIIKQMTGHADESVIAEKKAQREQLQNRLSEIEQSESALA